MNELRIIIIIIIIIFDTNRGVPFFIFRDGNKELVFSS